MVAGAALVRRVSAGAATLLLSLAMLPAAGLALPHPMHTTITELAWRPGSRVVRATIRIFEDDFGRAVLGLPASAPAPDSAAVREPAAEAYVRAHFGLAGAGGAELPLRWCGVRRSGNVVWVCIESGEGVAPAGLRVRNGVLFELYRDQVNIVQSLLGSAKASVLFTRGDGPKAIL